jgi:hypothetical protein
MLVADRLTLHLHDDTTVALPTGTRYELTATGGRYVTPDGDQGTWSSWAVLHLDTYTRATRDERPDA